MGLFVCTVIKHLTSVFQLKPVNCNRQTFNDKCARAGCCRKIKLYIYIYFHSILMFLQITKPIILKVRRTFAIFQILRQSNFLYLQRLNFKILQRFKNIPDLLVMFVRRLRVYIYIYKRDIEIQDLPPRVTLRISNGNPQPRRQDSGTTRTCVKGETLKSKSP